MSGPVYRRMTERGKEAQAHTGKKRAEKIRASADRERILNFNVTYDAEQLRC